MNKKILFLILPAVLLLPRLVSAFTIYTMIDASVNLALYIASGVVVILWIITGILFLTASGDPAKLKTAKTALIASVAGTVLVIVASGAIGLVSSAFDLNS